MTPFIYDEEKEESTSSVSVRFDRSIIRFSNEDKIHFAQNLQHYLLNLTSNRDRTVLFAEDKRQDAQDENRNITTKELQAIALRLFAALENLLDLSEDSVINALEASTAINVSTIEQNLSRTAKIGWLQAIIDEMEESDSAVALRTAQRLVDHFQCRMPKSVARILSNRFQLPMDDLVKLKPSE